MRTFIEATDAVLSRLPILGPVSQAAGQRLESAAARQQWDAKQQRVDDFLKKTGAEELLLEVLRKNGFSPEVIHPEFNDSHKIRFVTGYSSLNGTHDLLVLRDELMLGMQNPDRLVILGGKSHILGPRLWEDRDRMKDIMQKATMDSLHFLEQAYITPNPN